jgi:cold shock CspA family protein
MAAGAGWVQTREEPVAVKVQGRVKWFDENRGCGIIRTDQGQDASVRYPDIEGEGYRSLSEGERVEFELIQQSGNLRAIRIRRTGTAC